MSPDSPAPAPAAAITETRTGTRPIYELRRWGRAARLAAREPVDVLERLRERLEDAPPRSGAARARAREQVRSTQLLPDAAWQEHLHRLLGQPWPCGELEVFATLWQDTVGSLGREGLSLGRHAYCGWDDADPGFARAAWCLTRHLRPRAAVETGVARGFTTRVILEGLQANGAGRLCSIDLPPVLVQPRLQDQTGTAVAEGLKRRWTLVRGSSRRRLPKLLAELGSIDLFVHDSRHTRRNVCFELTRAWSALNPGGFLLVDDIHRNPGFALCVREFGCPPAIVCPSDDRRGVFGLIQKPAAAWTGESDPARPTSRVERT